MHLFGTHTNAEKVPTPFQTHKIEENTLISPVPLRVKNKHIRQGY